METLQQYGYYYWGPFTGPGPISYTISRIDNPVDVFLFDEPNFQQYQFDAQRPKPYQTNYVPIRASEYIDTVKSEGPIALASTTNYYLVVDGTYIGDASGTTNNAGQTIFPPNRFYYEITGLDPGQPVASGYTMVSAASPVASLSTIAVVAAIALALFL